MRTFVVLAFLAVAYGTEVNNREGKLFLVSSSTTTSTLSTSTICYTTNAAAACVGRKKRTIQESPIDTFELDVAPVSR